MAGTDLDPILRNLGVRTIVVTGVSVNVAITNLVIDAVNPGYSVVVPRDAVCGIPREYAAPVTDTTLSLHAAARTSVVSGKRVSVRVEHGGPRSFTKTKH